ILLRSRTILPFSGGRTGERSDRGVRPSATAGWAAPFATAFRHKIVSHAGGRGNPDSLRDRVRTRDSGTRSGVECAGGAWPRNDTGRELGFGCGPRPARADRDEATGAGRVHPLPLSRRWWLRTAGVHHHWRSLSAERPTLLRQRSFGADHGRGSRRLLVRSAEGELVGDLYPPRRREAPRRAEDHHETRWRGGIRLPRR